MGLDYDAGRLEAVEAACGTRTMAMATQALLSRCLLPGAALPASPLAISNRHITPCCLPLFPRYTSSVSSASESPQRRGFQVPATAAQSESLPPPTPEADIVPTAPPPPKPTLKKGQIVRVDREKYLNSVEYLSVGHPPYFTGLDYIYEDRGEVLNVRFFDHGEYALIAWAGIPTSPAWLPTYMLIKADRLSYKRD